MFCPSNNELEAIAQIDNIEAELAELRSAPITLDRARAALLAICGHVEHAAAAFAALEQAGGEITSAPASTPTRLDQRPSIAT